MKALITGSNGSCAFYLKNELERHGDEVYGLARPEHELLWMESYLSYLDDVRPDIVYHLASDADVRGSWEHPGHTLHNNIQGTVNLFEALRSLKQRPIIQVCSTSEVYGNPSQWPIGETWPIQPANPYAVSKAAQDALGAVYAASYGFRVVRTRAFGYINPKRAALSLTAFAKQIVEIENGERRVLRHGNLDSIRTFCDVRDIVAAYRLAANLEGVYNIGSEESISVGECLNALISYSKCAINLEYDPDLTRPFDITNIVPYCRKFNQATGWRPRVGLKESLQWLLECCRIEADKKEKLCA